MSVKVSVSLSEEAVDFLDQQTSEGAFASRSGAVQAAVALLRRERLADAYASAYAEWGDEAERDWDRATSDGLAS